MSIALFWFRRDLRLDDNAGFYRALKEEKNVQPLFIFDTDILDKLEDKKDPRVDFIHQTILKLQEELTGLGSSFLVKTGKPVDVFKQLAEEYTIKQVYTNHDYEPAAIERDAAVEQFLQSRNITFHSFKDQCIFEKNEVLKDDGSPYTIFTPYSKKWKKKLQAFHYTSYPCKKYYGNLNAGKPLPVPSLKQLGFEATSIKTELPKADKNLIKQYKETRDFPALQGTSRLSMHLRFGTISIRKLLAWSLPLNETYVNELIWRDFYMMILFHFPQVEHSCFKRDYEHIKWRNNEKEFEAWSKGQTGYPIVDAGMRELNATGFMHNRVRMIVASFLTKHLLIDYRWGEAYFAQKLNDFDLSANSGGWQWAAGCGCDAAPYFRVFNPYEQTKKFDPEFKYIRKWVPEYEDFGYPQPIVEHKFARERALKVYKEGLEYARGK
ncbi:MAG: Deoxyribodipyrimidine photo-lyase [Bacteroidetes bacterium]|jgi:deoxyribodipyrimidine photo-lyase|nr:Deoxyribodipyrimidine photo-lyase [Bacteroidota bacterium]